MAWAGKAWHGSPTLRLIGAGHRRLTPSRLQLCWRLCWRLLRRIRHAVAQHVPENGVLLLPYVLLHGEGGPGGGASDTGRVGSGASV